MPEPTYRETTEGGETRYTCILADASRPEGICGHWSRTLDALRTHMQQHHGGEMTPEDAPPPPPPPAEAAVPTPSPPPPGPEPGPTEEPMEEPEPPSPVPA